MTAAANACGPPDGCRSPSGHFTVSNSCGQITYQQQATQRTATQRTVVPVDF
jgi:hypothetical protein